MFSVVSMMYIDGKRDRPRRGQDLLGQHRRGASPGPWYAGFFYSFFRTRGTIGPFYQASIFLIGGYVLLNMKAALRSHVQALTMVRDFGRSFPFARPVFSRC